jgi:ABC-type Na+ transport system ATPase subunit NatA
MPATPDSWLNLLATAKAVFDVATSGLDFLTSYKKHREEEDTIHEAQRASVTFSTYSDAEIRAIAARLKGCQDKFVLQGKGEERRKCYCKEFKEVIEGNGGRMPSIDAWERMYDQMCGPKVR